MTQANVVVSALCTALALWPAQASKPGAPFKTPLTVAEMTSKQAVVTTSAGTFVIDLRPDLAPNHVGYFMKLARGGAYDGTIFHVFGRRRRHRRGRGDRAGSGER